ncbi:hypothetical protein [Nocardia aurea]|uniref:ESX secretion-associated protein EspG n=1 Tax=Nocardia aurea TaxID=2144174 RepID=A0ABV3G577_9NOCA
MDGSELSNYEIERFGDVAPVVHNAVMDTVPEAQDAALRVHHEQGYPDRDAYSSALRVNLNRGLLDRLRGVPGIEARKPEGQRARFHLPVITQTGVALYWWRVPGDGKTHLLDARIRDVSGLQQHLMTLAPSAVSRQMSIEHAEMSEEEINRYYDEAEHFSQQMRHVDGRTVTLWVSASPDGLFDFGWGDGELVDAETGQLAWPRWESLKNATTATHVPTLHLVDRHTEISRFDADAPVEDELNLSRRPAFEEPVSEEQPSAADENTTGSEDR